MKVGASYYPEVMPKSEWERDLETGRRLGLTCLRCGEFAWSAFSRDGVAWTPDWALEFLELAHRYEFEVIWCTPTAAPPPYLHQKWPDLQAVSMDGRTMPVGIRRNYCPSHVDYQTLCAAVATRLAQSLASFPAIVGWQIDNELAGDGFTCWCSRCQKAFHKWLQARYETLPALNEAWQTAVWSQTYTAWSQIPVPIPSSGSHAPAIQLDYRRFRSDNWLNFYLWQYQALLQGGARCATTNFYGLEWHVPFDQWHWMPYLNCTGLSLYNEDSTSSRFQLALLAGPKPGEKALWVLEQKAGQQAAQNLYPDDLSRIENHLRTCARAGAEYAIYWHLRQHSAGSEMEHGAILRHDGKPTRIAQAVQSAIRNTVDVSPIIPGSNHLLVFSFHQQWANETRPHPGTRWSYREEVEQNWYGGARDALGGIRVGGIQHISPEHKLVLAPFLQLEEPGIWENLRKCLDAGGAIITTADLARLDNQNNVRRVPPLNGLARWLQVPSLEVLHLAEGTQIQGRLNGSQVNGRIFWALPDGPLQAERLGEAQIEASSVPMALRFRIGKGALVVVLTAPDRAGVAELVWWVLGQSG